MTKKFFLMCMAILLAIHSAEAAKAPDYSKASSWCQIPAMTKEVDTFYILATEYMGFNEGDPDYATMDNVEMVEGAPVQYAMNASTFADSTNVFMPFYRQSGLRYAGEIYKRDGNIDAAISGMPYNDITAALDYYFKNYNNGRPFILASHSQGSAIAQLVLKKYFKEHPRILRTHGCGLCHRLRRYEGLPCRQSAFEICDGRERRGSYRQLEHRRQAQR